MRWHRIQGLVLAFVPELKPGGLKIVDSQGRAYNDPANLALLSRSRAQIRQEELTAEIRSQLEWIEGIRVSVKLDHAPPAAPEAGTPGPAIMAPNVPLELESGPGGGALPGATGRGIASERVRELAGHWRTGFDWRKAEAELNRHPQFVTEIDGQRIQQLNG